MKDEKYLELTTGSENYIKYKNKHFSFHGSSDEDRLCKVDGLYVAEGVKEYFYCLEAYYSTLFDGELDKIEISSLEKKEVFGVIQRKGGGGVIKKFICDDFNHGYDIRYVIIIPKGTLKKGKFKRKDVIFIPKK